MTTPSLADARSQILDRLVELDAARGKAASRAFSEARCLVSDDEEAFMDRTVSAMCLLPRPEG